MIECSKEDFASNQERRFNSYKGAAMNDKFVTKSIVFEENWKKPQSTETFDERAAREFPKNIQRAIDSQKK
jgi:hypothetical protein